jgi:hypothetical protein
VVHKSSNDISKNHAVVFIEDLQVKNRSASAKGRKAKPGSRFARSRDSTVRFSTPARSNCGASGSTTRRGTAVFSSPCRPRTQAAGVLSAGTHQHRIATRKPTSCASSVASAPMRIGLVLSTSKRRDSPR